MGSELIGSGCGVGWSAEASAIAGKAVIGRDLSREAEWSTGVAGFGKEVRHFLLLGRKIVKVDACSAVIGGRHLGRGRVWSLNRVRGAVLFFALCKTFLQTLADIVGDRGFLKPGLNVSKSLVGEAEFREENASWGFRGGLIAVSGEEIRDHVFLAGKVLNLEVALGEDFPPSAKTTIV